ncbi:hypothetical protein NDU88_003005 [Pleurodeles waltl]|uniref:Uncharacterized protein n=1 Tax=Pleurodeles waltl TaxID=8319 RepID=A0AAV7KXC8_PLEWA|nr:hypothetical protein NDU88_003005 [Pleurodeles waltl]
MKSLMERQVMISTAVPTSALQRLITAFPTTAGSKILLLAPVLWQSHRHPRNSEVGQPRMQRSDSHRSILVEFPYKHHNYFQNCRHSGQKEPWL